MRKPHALAVSILVGVAAVAGVLALGRTVALGQATQPTPVTDLAARSAALDRAEAEIARLQSSVPPALPARSTPLARPPQIVQVRTVQAAASDHEPDVEDDDERGDDDDGRWQEERDEQEGWDD